METLSQDCQHGCPWEKLYRDDLVIIDESLDGLLSLQIGKTVLMQTDSRLTCLRPKY